MSEIGSKRILIHENILNDMLHDAVVWLVPDLQFYHLLPVTYIGHW